MSKNTVEHVAKVDLLLIHMGRDQGGRPRVEKVFEVSVEDGRLVLALRRPS
jgi:hypothetical protein